MRKGRIGKEREVVRNGCLRGGEGSVVSMGGVWYLVVVFLGEFCF